MVVEGEGGVGEFPKLMPRDTFSYNSYHVIAGDSKVTGAFFGVGSKGAGIFVKIHPFSLKYP